MHTVPMRLDLGHFLLAAALALVALVPNVAAQTLGQVEGRQLTGNGGYYINALPDEPTIRIGVRGDLPRTGVYLLGAGFDTRQVIAMAGGPSVADLDPQDPTVRIRLYRGDRQEIAYEALYQEMLRGGGEVPDLQEGDTIEVKILYERRVYVWGAVRNPGYFQIGPAVDAVRLLALAGGPQGTGARADDIINEATVSIIRPGQGKVYDAPLEAFVAGTDVPSLLDGDALQVDVVRRDRFTLRDGLSIVGSVAALALVVLRIADSVSD